MFVMSRFSLESTEKYLKDCSEPLQMVYIYKDSTEASSTRRSLVKKIKKQKPKMNKTKQNQNKPKWN